VEGTGRRNCAHALTAVIRYTKLTGASRRAGRSRRNLRSGRRGLQRGPGHAES